MTRPIAALDTEAARKHFRHSLLAAFGTAVIAVTIYAVVPLTRERWPVGVLISLAAVVAAVPLTMRRLHSIAESDHPLGEAIEALSLMISMVIVGFSAGYYALGIHTDQFDGLTTKIDALYFTVVTMGTVGFGDIHPSGQGARAMVTANILVNLVLLGTGVRLVTNVAKNRQEITQQVMSGPPRRPRP